jgi:3-methyl-2-oxobutanoate hydroxymethyltransferase
MLGLFDRFTPSFVQKYADLHAEMGRAFAAYKADVEAGAFPSVEHSLAMDAQAWKLALQTLEVGESS